MSDSGATRGSVEKPERTGVVTFLRQVVAELRKVVWPTRPQLIQYFIVVMTFVVVMMAFVSLLDLGFGRAVYALFGSGN